MDLDAYSAAHSTEWDDLARLGSKHRFTGAESDALIELYQSAATDLSAIATSAGQSVQGDRVSLALYRARLRFTGASANAGQRLVLFFGAALPAALYRIRWLTLVIAAVTVVIAMIYGFWIGTHPQILASMGTDAELRKYAQQDFTSYYSDHTEGSFAGKVWTNNAFIAAQSIAFGIFGVWVPVMIFHNASGIGESAAVMAHYGRLGDFFLYIAPHGQLELYSVFTAAAAGLLIFWSWVAPGARTRGQALAEDGRAFFSIVVGLTLSLLVSGIIEGFVTRQPWPWPVKIGIGTVALTAFLLYQWMLGGRAHRAGHTGDLDEFEAGSKRLISA